MLCPNCQVTLSDTATQCYNCGVYVAPAAQAQESPYAAADSAAATAATANAAAASAATASAAYAANDGQTPFQRGYQQGYEWAQGNATGQTAGSQPTNPYGQAYGQPTNPYGQPSNPYGQQGYQQPAAPVFASANQKNHLVAGLLAIFLGSLGIHKFYLGYTKQGVIMLLVTLLTFGLGAFIMEVVALIEGVIYLVKSDEEFYYTYELGDKPWF